MLGVFDSGGKQYLYFDGKLSATRSRTEAFNADVNTLTLGGFLRNNATSPTDPYKGDIDDAGLFNAGLTATDVALIHGLGRTGGIGLDQLDEAQALLGGPIGSTSIIGGATWQHVSGLAGSLGDFGGTVAGGDAYVVTSASGDGILQVVPEPSTGMAAAGILAGTLLRRRRMGNR